MRGHQTTSSKAPILNGWKEIAEYLDRGLRTVQRYERTLGLPVRRPAGKSNGTVIATKAELDAWVMASPIREAFQLSSEVDPIVAAQGARLKSGIAEMDRLRRQMIALRAELRTSMELFRNVLSTMRQNLHSSRLSEGRREISVLEPAQPTQRVLDLLEIDSRRKAS